MTQTQTRHPSPGARLMPGLLVAIAGGLLTGGFAAAASYVDLLNPLAHAFALWIVLVALVSARQTWRVAALRSGAGLVAAVLSFYVGKKVVYDDRYSPPLLWNGDEVVEWLALAVLAGGLLGWAFHRIGRSGRAGALSTGAAIALVIGDAGRRLWSWHYGWNGDHDHQQAVLLIAALVGVALTAAVGVRSRRQLGEVVCWSVPMAVLGYVLVSLPDVLEQLLIT
jgi:hypothetical protein